MLTNRSLYANVSNNDLIERMMSLAAELPDDLDDSRGDVSYLLDNIRSIIDVLEDRAESDDEE